MYGPNDAIVIWAHIALLAFFFFPSSVLPITVPVFVSPSSSFSCHRPPVIVNIIHSLSSPCYTPCKQRLVLVWVCHYKKFDSLKYNRLVKRKKWQKLTQGPNDDRCRLGPSASIHLAFAYLAVAIFVRHCLMSCCSLVILFLWLWCGVWAWGVSGWSCYKLKTPKIELISNKKKKQEKKLTWGPNDGWTLFG
jgi:hypothetical protein